MFHPSQIPTIVDKEGHMLMFPSTEDTKARTRWGAKTCACFVFISLTLTYFSDATSPFWAPTIDLLFWCHFHFLSSHCNLPPVKKKLSQIICHERITPEWMSRFGSQLVRRSSGILASLGRCYHSKELAPGRPPRTRGMPHRAATGRLTRRSTVCRRQEVSLMLPHKSLFTESFFWLVHFC